MPGSTIGPYCVLEKIGAGGMGEVYLAEDPRLGRRVALKTVNASSVSPDAREPLLREARAAARLNHPNIAAVYDVLDQPSGLHIVMEYVEGETLAAAARRGRIPVDKAVQIGIQLMDALADAHAHGIVHRDIKPGNIMITPDGRVKVLDFGLAKTEAPPSGASRGSQSGVVLGTVGYIAPERLLGRKGDHRADVYAAGVLLFELLTGRLPYDTGGEPELAVLSMTEPPPPPNALNGEVPESLSRVVTRALAPDVRERYSDATQMKRDLLHVAHELADAVTRMAGAPSPGHAAHNPRIWLKPLGGAAIVALVAVAVWFARPIVSQPKPAEAFGPREWVLIADFDNRTAEPLFEHTLRTTLETALQQSRYVNVFPRAQAFDALRRMRVDVSAAPPIVVDEARALEIARRENIKVVLAGSALASGEAVQIGLRATASPSGALLFSETRRFTRKEDLFETVDSLALAVREKLGEAVASSGGSTQPLARVTTTSLQALQLYSRANDAFAGGNVETSRDLFEAALKLDPDFAMAHVRLGAVYASLGQFDKWRDHYTRAYALRTSVTEREAHGIESKYYEVHDQYEEARDSWRVLTQLYPDDLTARLELAIALHETGEVEAAVPELRHVLRLNPFHGSAHARLVLALARIGRPDEALRAYDAAVAQGVQNPFITWGAGLARMARRQNDQARELFLELEKAGHPYTSLGDLSHAQLDVLEGRVGAARRRLVAGLALDVKTSNVAYELLRRYLLGRVLLLLNDSRRAEAEAQAILQRGENLLGQNLYQAGTLLVRANNTKAARRPLESLGRLHDEMPSAFHKMLLDVLSGEVALAEGRVREAEAAFEAASGGYPGAEAHDGLAATHARVNRWPEARQQLESLLEQRGTMLQTGFAGDWPLAHLALARICRQTGDRECATRHYEAVLDLWARADSFPARRQAEDELRQLASGR